ncbi:putative ribosomal protein S15P [Rosa chinensis]|uniref:Putative ribosomal protein S15P n=1 Tax=Rosa chinensis TaxID=74649 RepID=A0A2P6PTR2_ROSCH|nr:putative ribosomal protein S15P [Rosa chinensis]
MGRMHSRGKGISASALLIGQVKSATGSKILRIMKAHGLAHEIPGNLYHLIKKSFSIRKYKCLNPRNAAGIFFLLNCINKGLNTVYSLNFYSKNILVHVLLISHVYSLYSQFWTNRSIPLLSVQNFR